MVPANEGKIMNQYVQQIYRDRCASAQEAADHIQQTLNAITLKWRRAADEGVLYSTTERRADIVALEKAKAEFQRVLESVYALEDAETNR